MSADLSGVCANDGGPPYWENLSGSHGIDIFLNAATPGTCNFTFTFATGFTYSGQVDFRYYDMACGCPPQLYPSTPIFQVNNPPSTCIGDAGAD